MLVTTQSDDPSEATKSGTGTVGAGVVALAAATDVVATLQLRTQPELAGAAAAGRRFVDENSDHLPAEMIDDAQLLVSEIIGNAVRYGRPDVTLRVRSDPPGIGIVVVDDGPGMPPTTPRPSARTDTSGRGLLIVDAIATSWGVIPSVPPPGKAVWFELDSAAG